MKTFGLVVPKGKGRIFEANVRRLLDQEHALAAVVLPLLEAWWPRIAAHYIGMYESDNT